MKAILVRDASTELPVVAFRVGDLSVALGQPILQRAGFGDTPEKQDAYVALWHPESGACFTEPYAWGERHSLTLVVAHLFLEAGGLDATPHGGAIDVEPWRLAIAEGRRPQWGLTRAAVVS